ncbi:hypothetical protein BN1263160104 [Stenotrophomonas indicatrix]|nr:hypothetical protein BN1263160104 [Stenotrophomonas indicatrix]
MIIEDLLNGFTLMTIPGAKLP